MKPILKLLLMLLSAAYGSPKDEDLPLCPTNIQFFPQTLPMHCRMPADAFLPGLVQQPEGLSVSTASPILPPFYRSPLPEKNGVPMPLIVSPGIPGPISLGVPGPLPIMPIHPPVPPHKLPVIVMPMYSPDPAFKKTSHVRHKKKFYKQRRPRYESISDTDTSIDTDTSTDTSTDDSTESEWWRKSIARHKNTRKFNRKHKSKKMKRKHNNMKKEMITPLLQYVTKDGYVIYEKEISNGEAGDWLDVKHIDDNENNNDNLEMNKQTDDYNQSGRIEYKIEDVSRKVNEDKEEKIKNTQKSRSKKKRMRSKKNGKDKALVDPVNNNE